MTIERVVFMQGQYAEEALELYNEHGVTALFNHLVQWHYPGEHEITDELGAGTTDRIIKIGNYVLTINSRVGYCGLEHIIGV